jgi:hypothetical protein
MPNIGKIADIFNMTLPTFERGKYDSVGIAQLYPDYEVVKQFVTAARKTKDSSYLIDTSLEIGAPSSFEASYPNHPAQTAAHKLLRRIQTPLVKVRTSVTFSEDEKELQGASDTKIVDIVQARMTKWDRDYWEGVEHSLLSAPTDPDQFPDVLRGLDYWVTGNSGVTTLDMHGGDDPTGFTAGAGGITKAQESRWPNAVAKFAKISQDDFFDKLDQFLNRVRMMALVPHPAVASEVPARVIYCQEPVKRAVARYFMASNDDIGNDGGVYRDANFFKSIPITIWHAMSDPASPVRPATGTVKLIDWNAFMFQAHSAFDRKTTGPLMLPNIPGQMVAYTETWHGLHCTRRDRNLEMTTATEELQPSAA